MRCAPSVYEAGGGGINVARGIKKLGGNALAIYLAGGNNGATLQSLLKAESLDTVLIDTVSIQEQTCRWLISQAIFNIVL
jgi:6-phosphofructokinase 2